MRLLQVMTIAYALTLGPAVSDNPLWVEQMQRLRSEPAGDLRIRARKLAAAFPMQSDWFMQDLDRVAKSPLGADMTQDAIPKNVVAFCKVERDSGFEQQLIQRVLAELADPKALAREFEALRDAQASVSDPAWLTLYLKACKVRRTQRLTSMARQSPKVVFIKRKMLRPSFYGYSEGLSCANFERNFEPGSALCLLELENGEPKVTELLRDEDGVFRDIDISWDGTRILFAWKKNLNHDDYHLYEMTWPERKIRQLTFGIGVADFEGRYLPDGEILFSSTRCISTTDCWKTEVSNLHTADPDGKLIRRLGYDQVVTCYPSVLDNGCVIYTRWDYNDRGQVYPQPLFQMNSDGTGQTEFYGNNSWFPTTINHARGIPGSDKVMVVLHGHHTWQAGELAIIDRNQGTQEGKGVQLIAPIRETKAVKVDRYGQGGNLHRHPYPLDENSCLVAMTPYMNARKDGQKHNLRFQLYWMDIDGHRELLAHDPAVSSAHPIPLAPRKRPHVRPSLVKHEVPHGTFFMQDIYEGPGLKGVERGSIEKLRVVEIDYRALMVGYNNSGGPGGSALVSTPVSTGNGTWDVKRILGEARVYEDGSANFKVPANTPVYFQAIDKNGSMAQTMRSWSTLMPNETYGCVGCHEDKNTTPPQTVTTLAMKAGAQDLIPFYGPARGFSFVREIQPILNEKCISCHDGKTREKEVLLTDLTGRRFNDRVSKRNWTHSYLNLTHSKHENKIRGNADHEDLNWVSAQSIPSMIPPYFRGSAKSKWMQKLRDGHGEMTKEQLDKFAAWIDLGVPFSGDYMEGNTWSDAEFKHYLQMHRKRERLAAENRESAEALVARKTGKVCTLPVDQPRYRDYAQQRGISPADIDRGYRNLNARRSAKDSRMELGRPCTTDKVVVTLSAELLKTRGWESGFLEFSDGHTQAFQLTSHTGSQTIKFPGKQTAWIKLPPFLFEAAKLEVWGR